MTDPHRPLKTAFGRFATGVAVASAFKDNGDIVAITINSFASVSLEPPLVLWCLEKSATAYDYFTKAAGYGVSVLHNDQEAISNRFAQRADVPAEKDLFESQNSGAPLLKKRLAGFDCELVECHEAGDHVILIAKVIAFDSQPGAPLLYFASNYADGPAAT